MAFASILRRSTTILSGRIVRAAQRNYISAINSVNAKSSHTKQTIIPFIQSYSTATDSKNPSASEPLLRVIDSEIKIAIATDDQDRVEAIPEGFPFKIDDNPGQQTLILTREYDGEHVKVEVYMPDLVTGDNNDIDYDDGTDTQKPDRSRLPLVVSVSKKSGASLEFHCVAYPDKILVDSISAQNPELSEDQNAYSGPIFQDLDEKLKKAFHKYLEFRGISPSTTCFLHEYMINKDSREFIGWLKDLKKFVEA